MRNRFFLITLIQLTHACSRGTKKFQAEIAARDEKITHLEKLYKNQKTIIKENNSTITEKDNIITQKNLE